MLSEYMKWKAYLQRCSEVPFHGDAESARSFHDRFAIVPGGSTSLVKMVSNLQVALERLEWLKMLASTPADQRKYTGTLTWLRITQSTWQGPADEYKGWQAQAQQGPSTAV